MLLSSFLASLIFQVTLKNYSILKSSNHVQSDNENFICVSGSSICHLHMSTYLNVCFIFLPLQHYFPMAFLTSLGNSIRYLS